MAGTKANGPFGVEGRLDGKRLREAVAEAGYRQEALAETLAISCPHEHQDVEVVYRRVKSETGYDVLVRLFWLGREVEEETLAKAVPGLDVDELSSVGLLHRRGGTVRSVARLGPYHELLLASDFGPETGRAMPAEHVLGVGAASLTLAGVTVRRKAGSALDLGTGAGIQAFLAARHCEQVVGTDTNERALNFARFNARLNGIESIDWRMGSLYEPVAGEEFELIVSNPPFVISPESRFVFRDTDLPGDRISEEVIRGAAGSLAEGGFACVLFNWHHGREDDWEGRPRSWVSGGGCDGWLISFKSAEPLTYAADWLGSSVGRHSEEYGRLLDEWTAYYERMGIGRISAGAMILRRRKAKSNWFRAQEIDKGRCMGSAGEQIERLFAAEDLLEGLADERELLRHRLILDSHHRLKHELEVEGGGWSVQSEHLFATEGIPFAGKVDMHIANLLAGCDGRRSLGELIEVMAGRLRAEPEKLRAGCIAVIRKLMQSGFLSSAGAAD